MLLGMDVGLGPGDFVFDGDRATPRKRHTRPTQFLAHVYCGHGRPSQLLLSSCFLLPPGGSTIACVKFHTAGILIFGTHI